MNTRAKKLAAKFSPIQQFVLSFLLLIFAGAFLLMLPASTIKGISFVDALFTSTSATCVTGLVVLDTGKDFTFFGQVIILLLIQFGGLGIMTFTIGIFSMFGGSFSDINMSDVETVKDALLTMAIGISTALYTTLVGMVCSEIIKLQLINIEAST